MTGSVRLNIVIAALLIFLSAALFWQINSTKMGPVNATIRPDQHDAYIVGARYHQTNSQGQLRKQLQVESGKHFPHQNTSELTQPSLDLYGLQGELWHISATSGTSTQGTDTLLLHDNVSIEHRKTKNAPAVTVTMDRLIVHPNQKTAETDSLVTMTYPQIVLTGKGLHGDLKAGTLKLLTDIRGHYEPLASPPHAATITHPEPSVGTAR